jgi:hypothetical protein
MLVVRFTRQRKGKMYTWSSNGQLTSDVLRKCTSLPLCETQARTVVTDILSTMGTKKVVTSSCVANFPSPPNCLAAFGMMPSSPDESTFLDWASFDLHIYRKDFTSRLKPSLNKNYHSSLLADQRRTLILCWAQILYLAFPTLSIRHVELATTTKKRKANVLV